MNHRIRSAATVAAAALVTAAALIGVGASSNDTAVAAALAVPTITSPPTISGAAQVGQTLTGEHGDWANGVTSYAYQWQRCDTGGASCVNIPGETSTVRVITAGDLGSTLRLRVIASNADGPSAPAFSAPSAVVVAAVAPASTKLPSITGTAREGQTLTADRGEWTNSPTAYAYQWQRCNASGAGCVNIPGETSNVRIITAGDVGSRLRVLVTASNAGGSSSAASATTDVVAVRGSAPVNTAAPTITGTATEGQTLTAANGSWSNSPTAYAYQWQRCNADGSGCANIAGETGPTRVLVADDVGKRLRVLVTASNPAGSAQAASGTSEIVASALPAGAIRLPNGQVSVPASSVSLPERLIVDRVTFNPNPVRSRSVITARFHVVDTRGYVVREAIVFARSVPIVTSTPQETTTARDGWATLTFTPRSSFPLKNGHNVQFFVRARKQGEDVLAGVSTRRLVQVRTGSPR